MTSQLFRIATMIVLVVVALKLLKSGAKLFSFLIWLLIVSFLVYFSLPWLDPYMQRIAKNVPAGSTCYGLVLESGDCFGLVK